MKKYLIIFLLSLGFKQIQAQTQQAVLLNDEAQKAFEFLNQVRANPPAYAQSIHPDLADIKPRPPLSWNEKLAKAAQAKALDMANKNYFGHLDKQRIGMNYRIQMAGYSLQPDWYRDKTANFFESLSAGSSTGIAAITVLIQDEGTIPPNHRNHLLGLTDFWANCLDIGIGFAYNRNSLYVYYMCVLIAKHDH